ncbi:photosystem II assembly protein Psb34 [Synechococcus sp. PCC 7336]|uniref:photosystem II assembly protein Psb34 n=1 Tax=Synechococcus sp. PCC 7336 TaxID=195250 RepID=UPI000347BB2F|nr:ssl1498 family light-harvesting-like protein [Synechococcus sp. PCC 7336]
MYRVDETGVTNNYADMPAAYVATYPTKAEQQTYALQGAVAILLVTTLLLTAFGVS